MENLPPELLENLFEQFCSVKDLTSCYNTNSRWRKIVKNIFKNKGKLIVAGSENDTIEIIDLINPTFKFGYKYPKSGDFQYGGVLQNKVIMGRSGSLSKLKGRKKWSMAEYVTLGQSTNPTQLLDPRKHASSVVLNENCLWITGGLDKEKPSEDSYSTEFISLDKTPARGPNLPFTVSAHTVVQVDARNIYLMGGIINRGGMQGNWNKTWIFDPMNNFVIKEGPSMKQTECAFSFAKMNLNGKIFILALPKWSDEVNVVQILDTTLLSNGWTNGPNLPILINGSKIVTSPTGKGVILIGGIIRRKNSKEFDNQNVLYELSGNSREELKWSVLDQQLHFGGRSFNHVVFPITDDICASLI